jgi:hypothetical protein
MRILGGIACSIVFVTASTARADDAACVTATEHALTLRQQGKLHDALKELATCSDTACPDEVKQECTKRLSEIDAVMPTLILAAKDLAGNDLADVNVTMDGAPLAKTLDGRPLTIDPGEHKFHFTYGKAPPLDKTFVVREGQRERRESVVIDFSPPKPAPFWGPTRMLGLGSALLGVTSLALGGVFGGFAIGAQNQERTDCAQGCDRYAQAVTDYNYAQMNATAATVLLITGGALVVTGVVLWLAAPRSSSVAVAPSVGIGSGAMVLRGTF